MDDLQDIRDRLARIEAIEGVRAIKNRYLRACDRKRPDDVLDCFIADGAHIAYTGFPELSGRDALVAIFRDHGCTPDFLDMHFGQNPEIRIDGADDASAEWDLLFVHFDMASRTYTQISGQYTDTYRRVEGDWKIASTVFERTTFLRMKEADGNLNCTDFGRDSVGGLPV